MSLDLFISNLLSPPILFFMLGVVAVVARSDLEIPPTISKLFSLYLLWAIGFKGGAALRAAGFEPAVLVPIAAAVVLSAAITVCVFPILRRFFNLDDTAAVAACYGSVSVVTFIAATEFLDRRGVEHGGEMVAALALMESPPIIAALLLRRWLSGERSHDEANGRESISLVIREALTSGPVFLLLGSLIVGALVGPAGEASLKVFTQDIFPGVLVLFLLDAGLSAGRRLREVRGDWGPVLGFGLTLPVVNAAAGLAIAYVLGLPAGNALLFTVLAASASYIAVPAAMRLAVPKSNPSLYFPMSLGITFPFNVCIGIPLYLVAVEALWPPVAAAT